MDWLDKIPKWIQIPLKILLPALCIFSGFLLLISDNLAEQLYLKEFREESGFIFGLIFAITLSLILVYIFVFASKPLIQKFKIKMTKQKVKRQIEELGSAEQQILFGLLKEPQHAFTFPMNDPTVNMLNARGYLFTYNQEVDIMTYGCYGIIFALQPIVVEALEKILIEDSNYLQKLKNKLKNCKKEEKINILNKEIEETEKYLNFIKNLSLKKMYRG